MKSNLFTGFLLSISLLPSLLFAQESEFVEDRSNSLVEFVDVQDQKPVLTTEANVKEDDVKKVESSTSIEDKTPTPSLAEKKKNLGIHARMSFAMPVGMTAAPNVDGNSSALGNWRWLGTKDALGAAFCYYFNDKMALVAGLDFHLLYFKSLGKVQQNHVELNVGNEFSSTYTYSMMESMEKTVYLTENKKRSLLYYQYALPISFRYHVMGKIWGQLGLELDYISKGKDVYDVSVCSRTSYFVSFGVGGYTEFSEQRQETSVPVRNDVIPNLLISAGTSWPLWGWNVEAALSLSYALKKIDFDYGISSNVFTIGLDVYLWFI